MKKTLLLSTAVIATLLTSCSGSGSHLNKKTILNNCEGIFLVEEDPTDPKANFFTAIKVDTIIDDLTPMNPEAVMPQNTKCVKICLVSDKTDYSSSFEMNDFNTIVHDQKTNKDYTPALRDNESSFEPSHTFIIVDVPKETNVEDLSIGFKISKAPDYSTFLALKSNPATETPNRVVKMDSVFYQSSVLYGGKTKVILKTITYNVDDNDAFAKKLRMAAGPLAKIAKVDVEYELVEGATGGVPSLSYLFTSYRSQFSPEHSTELPVTIDGTGTKLACSYYFALYANETIDYIADSFEEAGVYFKINPKAK